MRKLVKTAAWMLVCTGLYGCPTTFSGSAHVVDGRAGCEKKCKKSKLRMSALVFLGEYSSACVCELPPPEAKSMESADSPAAARAASLGAAVSAMQQTVSDPDAPMPPIGW